MESALPAVDVTDGLRIYLLGSFRLLQSDRLVAGFDQARLQQLLAYFLVHRHSPISRQQLAFLFWPDSTDEQARTNLRNLWHRLRRTLPDADRFLFTDELTIQWRGDAPCWLDVAEFEAHLEQARSAADADKAMHLEQAAALYGGELLPGCYADWLLAERDRLAQSYGHVLEQLASLHEARRDYRQAIGHVQALLRHDPLHEPAYARLMRLHALNDDRAAALHTYHTCATVLRRELNVEPDSATRELYDRLLNQAAEAIVPVQFEATTPLVGREDEWGLLQRAWREAAGRPRLVLISGEAGIGKTRLAEALVEWVARQGVPALTARCYATEGELAYAPVVAWLRGQARSRLADPWLRELARLLPEILIERPDLPPPEPLSENWQRLRLFEALAQALLSGQRALLLFLDDLQWCDHDTLDWLHYLLTARLEPATRPRLLLVAAIRSEGGESAWALEAWKAGLTGTGQLGEIELGPLSQEATLELADRIAGRPLDRTLGPLLYQGTEGHPLFIVEMVRAGLAQGASIPARHAAAMMTLPTSLPARVRQVIQARLAQLSPTARGMIEVASVIGRAFAYAALAHATDLSEDLLVGCLDECWRKRIIREQGDGAYDFGHDQVREVVYAGLSRTRRRWLHSRVAQALETVHAGDLDAVAGMIAGHLEAAGLPAQAITYYDRAAATARRIYAHGDALAALEKAIALQEALPDAVRCGMVAHLHEEMGDLRELLVQHGSARNAYATALDCAGDADKVVRARLHRKIGKTLENERAGYAQVSAQYDAAEALLGAPEKDAAPSWWDEWCQVQLDYLILQYWWVRPDAMAERLARARPLIERHATPAQRALLFGNLSRQLNQSHRYAPSDTALEYARAALSALPPSASPELRLPYQFGWGFNLLWHGDYDEAEAALQAALDLAELTGDVTLQARCLAYLVVAFRRQGHDAEVEAHAQRGLAVAATAGALEYSGACRAGLAWVMWRHAGTPLELAEAERLAQSALEAWRAYTAPYPLHWQALWPLIGVALARAQLADAILHTRQLLDSSQQLLPPPLEKPLGAALAAWDAGRIDEASNLLCHALDLAQQMNFS